ncbi:hypothetical protein U1763_17530 [Sphingomonas sp. LB2R24]|uniref:hypothetical protein n=1 Tax=Sphingomonas sorbitolis TaxID=3096165 RepID=UPI002FC90E99
MADLLRPDAFKVTVFDGTVLIEASGLAATLEPEAAQCLADQLLEACGSARLHKYGKTP